MKKINQIAVLGASACDLGCSYCYLGKNCAFSNQDPYILEAWINGSYLKNVQEVLKVFDSDPNEVFSLQLWGGEPTLHMKELQENGVGT
jgi:sulfatase maturation enzyme AslB (radical SAM superfamily)